MGFYEYAVSVVIIKNSWPFLVKQEFYSDVVEETVPTEAAVFGVSKFNQSKFSDGVSYNEVKDALDSRNNSKSNNIQDTLIADTASNRGFTLVTHDKDLREVSQELGIECAVLDDLKME